MNLPRHVARLEMLLLVLFSSGSANAVEPAIVFCDQMVLQRGVSAPVWGRGEPGERVTVTFAGQTKQAKTGADSLWHVKLDAMSASAQPWTMTIKGKDNTVALKDVLVGAPGAVSCPFRRGPMFSKYNLPVVLSMSVISTVM